MVAINGKNRFSLLVEKNKEKEVILKVGFGEKHEDFYTFGKLIKQYKPIHVGVSFLKIINY